MVLQGTSWYFRVLRGTERAPRHKTTGTFFKGGYKSPVRVLSNFEGGSSTSIIATSRKHNLPVFPQTFSVSPLIFLNSRNVWLKTGRYKRGSTFYSHFVMQWTYECQDNIHRTIWQVMKYYCSCRRKYDDFHNCSVYEMLRKCSSWITNGSWITIWRIGSI